MAKKQPEASAPIQLLDLVWGNVNTATSHSYERINHAMQAAVALAIGAGMEWAEGDFAHARQNYRSGYWLDREDCYTCAVRAGNMSAIKSIETAIGRQGFIADEVDLPDWGLGRNFVHLTGRRQRERLTIGAEFPWKGQQVKVTSFADDNSSLTACSYKPSTRHESKVAKRYTITRDDIIAERAEKKERGDLMKKLSAVAETSGNGKSAEILKALGIKKREEFDTLPLPKIRKVAEQFCA